MFAVILFHFHPLLVQYDVCNAQNNDRIAESRYKNGIHFKAFSQFLINNSKVGLQNEFNSNSDTDWHQQLLNHKNALLKIIIIVVILL